MGFFAYLWGRGGTVGKVEGEGREKGGVGDFVGNTSTVGF